MGVATKRGGGRRRGRRGGANAISEINVTPLVDVMLVLLIVFMVAAPLLTVGVPIDLPQTSAQTMQPERKPIMITVSADGVIFLDKEPITINALLPAITTLIEPSDEARIYVRGDTAVQYGAVMQVMGALSGAGFTKIGLITAQEMAP